MGHDQVAGGDGQTGIRLSADVGALDQADTGLRDHCRQLHAAAFVILRGGHQAGFAQYLEGFGYFRTHDHLAVFKARLVFIAGVVVRGKGFAGDFQGQLDSGIKGIAAMVFIARKLAKTFDIQQFVK